MLHCQQVKVNLKGVSSPAYLGIPIRKYVFFVSKKIGQKQFFSLAVSSSETINDLKYLHHPKKSLIHVVINWINKT